MSAENAAEMDCRAICVDPARVREFWPYTSSLIRRAIERGGLSRFDDVERDILAGASLLWLAWDGRAVAAAAVTQLAVTDAGKVCILVACGGTRMRRWLPLLAAIETYARSEMCALVRILGRKGWMRVLSQYQAQRIILEKKL